MSEGEDDEGRGHVEQRPADHTGGPMIGSKPFRAARARGAGFAAVPVTTMVLKLCRRHGPRQRWRGAAAVRLVMRGQRVHHEHRDHRNEESCQQQRSCATAATSLA